MTAPQSERDFALGTVLSVTTGLHLSRDSIGAIYEILNHMTGDNLFTHQLPRAMRECAPWLLRQHPHLADVDASGVTDWDAWLTQQEATFGVALPVAPIPMDDHTRRDPVEELQEMVGDKPVIVVQT